MDRTLYDLRDLINRELDEIVKKGTLTSESLCNVDKAVDILKDISEIESGGEDYSMYPDEYRMDYRRDARRRDSRGRYMRGYEDSTMEHLEDMMHNAKTEQEREMIRKWMAQAEGR